LSAGKDRYGRLTSFIYEPMRYFVKAVLEGSARESTFEDDVANVRVISAVCESLACGGVVGM